MRNWGILSAYFWNVSEFKYFKQLKIKQVCNRIETKSSKLLLFQLKSYCMVYFPRHHRLSIFLFFCVGNLFPGRNYCDVSHIFEHELFEETSFHSMKGTLFRNLGQFLQSWLPWLRIVIVFLSSSWQVLDHISDVTTSKYFQLLVSHCTLCSLWYTIVE